MLLFYFLGLLLGSFRNPGSFRSFPIGAFVAASIPGFAFWVRFVISRAAGVRTTHAQGFYLACGHFSSHFQTLGVESMVLAAWTVYNTSAERNA